MGPRAQLPGGSQAINTSCVVYAMSGKIFGDYTDIFNISRIGFLKISFFMWPGHLFHL